MTEGTPRLAVVIGMGRSGTSLLCQILQRLGCYFGEPQELIRATLINPRGQFEHIRISQVLEHCLKANQIHHWITERGIHASWFTTDGGRTAREALLAQIENGMIRAVSKGAIAYAFKDPRATLFLPLVENVARSLSPEYVYFRCLRHPDSVYASVQRTGAPTTQRTVLGAWARYYTESQRVHALDVWYEDWFADPVSQLLRVARHLGIDDPPLDALEVIEPKLQHHRREVTA